MDAPAMDTPERLRKVLPELRREMHTRRTREIATVVDIKTPHPVTTGLHGKATTVSGHRPTGRSNMAVRRMVRRSIKPGSISLAAIGCQKTLPEIHRKIMEAGRAPAT